MMKDFEDRRPAEPLSIGEIALATVAIGVGVIGYAQWAAGLWTSIKSLFS